MGGLEPKNVSFSDQQQGNQILRSAAIDRERGSDPFIAGRLEHFPVRSNQGGFPLALSGASGVDWVGG
jgi:hypothetical protein